VVAEQRQEDDARVLRAWGQVIRRYRQWKSLSRRELAARAGVSPVFLGEIERGEKDPSSHTLTLIAAALDAPLSELYLRVAAWLDGDSDAPSEEQTALPLGMREQPEGYLAGVPRVNDETAFDLYQTARVLTSEQQVSLLVIARSLARVSRRQESR